MTTVSRALFGWKVDQLNIAKCTSLLLIGCMFCFILFYLGTLTCLSNAMVSLAFQLENQRLMRDVRTFLDWTLEHQGSDGWLGPEPFVANATIPRLVWPRYLLLLGLIVSLYSRRTKISAYKLV